MTTEVNHTHGSLSDDEPAWVHGHAHDPNPAPPGDDPAIILALPDGAEQTLTVADLQRHPQTVIEGCYIISTGHGVSGPFAFGGVQLADLLHAALPSDLDWAHADVVSADNFGTRVLAGELSGVQQAHPVLLSYAIDGQTMTRAQGLVRLIVPSETDDALRQVKWVARIEVH